MNKLGYFSITRTGTYGFILALPLLAAYEVLILLVNEGTQAPVRVGADVWIKDLISLIGDPGMFAIGLVVLLTGILIFFRERRQGLPLRPRYFGFMLLESLFYAILVAFVVSRVVGALFYNGALAGPQGVESLGMGRMLALSLGAGLYEELVFRVILVGGLYWIFSRVWGRRSGQVAEGKSVRLRSTLAYGLAALIGAVLFSAVHYIGAFGDPFTLPSFTFRFLFGLALNALFLTRGFGVAAWTHAIYDVLVVTNAF